MNMNIFSLLSSRYLFRTYLFAFNKFFYLPNCFILFKITSVKELYCNKENNNFLLVGCSFKSSGILFVCQLPTLTTIRCIELPNQVYYFFLNLFL